MISQSSLKNRLLARLPAHDYGLVCGLLEPMACPINTVFAEPGRPIDCVFFLEAGIASVVVKSPDGRSVEGGIIGREGFVSPLCVLGSDRSPHLITALIAGTAHRMPRAGLVEAINRSAAIRECLLRFAHVATVQSTFTLLSNAVHQMDERLARWLLMCHDRSDSDDIRLTHEFMALMLAVRRPSVTNALHILEGHGFIRTERGYVEMLNRQAMEAFAGGAYGKPEAEYRRLLGPL